MEARDSFCFPKNTKNPNPSPIGKKFGFSISAAVLPVDIPTRWDPQAQQSRTVALLTALRVAALFGFLLSKKDIFLGRHSCGSRTRTLTKAPLGLWLRHKCRRPVQVLLSAVECFQKDYCKRKETAFLGSCL